MDANVGALSENLKSSEDTKGPDCISSLSKDILAFILSQLPTKEAVQTSVLSTTWVDIWKLMVKVDFDDESFREINNMNRVNTSKFVNFVNGALLHLDLSNLQDFSMKLSNRNYDTSMLTSWISSVLKEKLQNLYIQNLYIINADVAFISWRSLAKCHTLVNLVLDMRCTINFPSTFSLQNLQVLRFKRVRFVKNVSPHSDDIILSFPSLKVFETKHCVCFNIILNAPKLESFSFRLYDHWLSNDDLVVIQESSFKIYSSPSTTFSYHGNLLHNFILLNPSACNASEELLIGEYLEERIQKTSLRCHMLIKHFSEVKCMKLKFNWFLPQGNDYYFTSLPVFGKLVYLEVESFRVETMLTILQSLKNLKTLVVKNYAILSFNKNIVTSAAVPSCFQSSLKDVKFKKFRGISGELTLVKFVLKNAIALENMYVSPTPHIGGSMNLNYLKMLKGRYYHFLGDPALFQ